MKLRRQQTVNVTAENCVDPCADYAVRELTRLLGKLGVRTEVAETESRRRCCALTLGVVGTPVSGRGIRFDGFRLTVEPDGIRLVSRVPKGLLNGVYALARQLGMTFAMPGDAGELIADDAPRSPEIADRVCNPVFPHRGVFDFPADDDRMRFYAKLGFNQLSTHREYLRILPELGIRSELGGHGLTPLLPRELFAEHPEYFRLHRPEDFSGARTADVNFCTGNPDAWRIVTENLAKNDYSGLYAVNLWGADLPGGGWCWCPMCRSLGPADQNAFAMKKLAETARRLHMGIRVPVIAYHDTLFPSRVVKPDCDNLFLFAPRERCYGHALDDASCPINRHYLAALRANHKAFRDCGDGHSFEYYCDQLLFRGMYPFLPGTIAGDVKAYRRNGVEAHSTLIVGGKKVTPDFNLLYFARCGWSGAPSPEGFIEEFSGMFEPDAAKKWRAYLTVRAAAFERAMTECGAVPEHCHLDFRWMPEEDTPFRRRQVRAFERSAAELERAADDLSGVSGPWGREEALRAKFEAASLRAMAIQQEALCDLARGRFSGDRAALRRGIEGLENLLAALPGVLAKADAAGLAKDAYYSGYNRWLTRETTEKLELYKKMEMDK